MWFKIFIAVLLVHFFHKNDWLIRCFTAMNGANHLLKFFICRYSRVWHNFLCYLSHVTRYVWCVKSSVGFWAVYLLHIMPIFNLLAKIYQWTTLYKLNKHKLIKYCRQLWNYLKVTFSIMLKSITVIKNLNFSHALNLARFSKNFKLRFSNCF